MAPPQKSTAFVLIPGGFCPGSFFRKVTKKLNSLGYAVSEIDLPTLEHTDAPPAGMYDDAAAVREAAASFMDIGKNVVVAANSYGGFVATEAMKELSEAERQAAGKSGGRLASLVYIGSLLPSAGLTCAELVSSVVDGLNFESDTDFLDPPPPEVGGMIMSDLEPEEAMSYVKQLKPQSKKAPNEPLTHEGYWHVPVTYVVTENDKTVAAEHQHKSVDAAIASGKGNIKKVPIKSDHCAMISHPDEIVQILLDAAQ